MKQKRFICAILTAALALSVCGCGSKYTSTEDAVTAGVAAKSTTGADGTAMYADGGEEGLGIERGYDMEAAAAEGMAADDAAAFNGPAERGTVDESKNKNLPEAGQLTAGEWNDNENWGFFKNLINSGTISFPSYGIDPTNRTMVTVKSADGSAVVNAKADLLDKDGNTIWSSVTNKEGIVYLFAQDGKTASSVEIESDGKKQSYTVIDSSGNDQSEKKTAAGSEMEVVFEGKGTSYKSMDIMFIVDTTGSMSDEMLFLQSEFTAITEEVGTANTRYSVNFYRDEGDDYVTKCNDFSSDTRAVQKLLNNEDADGGGDWPEAVAEIMTETMFSKDWNDDSVKLAFIIFDAPPHEEKTDELLAAVQEAANKGIRLIPVICSDNDRDTELFGRALAITTGGTYVFLTDDSGIGNSHQEPIIGSYEVRPLFNVIVDIINSYKQ